MRITRTATMMLLATAGTASMMQPASALEAEAFVDRVEEVYRHLGYELDFGPATLDGNTITVDGVTANLVETPDAEGVTTDTTFTFSGVTEREDGSYLAESLTVPDLDTPIKAQPPGNVTLADILVEGIYLPAGEPTTIDMLQLIKSVSTGALTITREGEEVVTMDSLESSSTYMPEQGTQELESITSEFTATNVWADIATLNEVVDGHARTMLEETGLDEISGDITQTMSWSLDDGHMSMDEFMFDFGDLGVLDINFELTGVTPELIQRANSWGEMMGSSEDEASTEEQDQAHMMEGMALLQGVEIVSAAIRYDDGTLVDNLIDFYADKNDVERAAYVDWLQEQVANMLASTGIPALEEAVLPPVESFLDNSESFLVRIAPPSPVSALVVMAAAANPSGLIDALGLSIQANQAAE